MRYKQASVLIYHRFTVAYMTEVSTSTQQPLLGTRQHAHILLGLCLIARCDVYKLKSLAAP